MRSAKTEQIDGVEHQVVICDITADSHPAYTGEKRFVDTAGRVEKFQTKFRRRRSRKVCTLVLQSRTVIRVIRGTHL